MSTIDCWYNRTTKTRLVLSMMIGIGRGERELYVLEIPLENWAQEGVYLENVLDLCRRSMESMEKSLNTFYDHSLKTHLRIERENLSRLICQFFGRRDLLPWYQQDIHRLNERT